METENKKTILVVDDEKEFVNILTLRLQRIGYETIVAHSGNDAFSIYQEKADTIDVILSDIRMTNGNGVELLKN